MQSSLILRLQVVAILCLTNLGFAQARPGSPETPVSGIGVALDPVKAADGYVVTKLVPNSPAALSCEIEPGDLIIAVGNRDSFPDDVEIKGLNLESVVGMIRGPVDSIVRLRIIPKSSTFVKEKIVEVKRRLLFGNDLIGEGLDMSLTSLDDRSSLTVDKFRGNAVVLILWSGKCDECLPHLKKLSLNLADQNTFPNPLELIAVNCDETIEQAQASLKLAAIDGLRQVWIDPKTRELVSSGGLPLMIVVAPGGRVEAVCHPDAINLRKFLKQSQFVATR